MASPSDVVKFDPNTLTDRLRERIRNSIADLIPEEAWDALVKKEMDAFFTAQNTRDAYGSNRTVESVFAQELRAVMVAETKKRMTAMMAKPEWNVYWDGKELQTGGRLMELAKKAGDSIITNWLATALGMFVQNVKQNITDLGR